MKKSQKNNSWILLLIGAAVSVSGCGKTSDVSLPATGAVTPPASNVPSSSWSGPWGTVTCGTGAYSFTDPNCLTDFISACSRVGSVVSTGSIQTCAISVGPVTVSSQSGILNPNNLSAPFAGNGIVVRAGDILSFSGAGSWGTSDVSTSSFLSIFHFTWGSYSCDKVNASGMGEGTVGSNQGFPMGLIGAVSGGSSAFFIGSGLNNFRINNSGLLHIGMNAPSDLAGVCGGFSGIAYLTVH